MVYYLISEIAFNLLGIALVFFLATFIVGNGRVTVETTVKVVALILLQYIALVVVGALLPPSPFVFILDVLLMYWIIVLVFNPPFHRALVFTFFTFVLGKVLAEVFTPRLTELLVEFFF